MTKCCHCRRRASLRSKGEAVEVEVEPDEGGERKDEAHVKVGLELCEGPIWLDIRFIFKEREIGKCGELLGKWDRTHWNLFVTSL